jgi:taurine dioxygenase
LFFRKQTLTFDQQVEVARIFGDPDMAKAYFPRYKDQKLNEVIETKPDGYHYGVDQWHHDITFSPNPPTDPVLYSQVIPPSGGDTLWSSGTRVYDSLSPSLQAYLEELEAVHSFEQSGWPGYFEQIPNGQKAYRKARAEYLPAVHKVVQKQPVTDRMSNEQIRPTDCHEEPLCVAS